MKKMLFLFILLVPILSGCSMVKNVPSTETGIDTAEIGNPYSQGSGHYAGYEWAERTGRACSGNSTSFIEGCEEYRIQINSK